MERPAIHLRGSTQLAHQLPGLAVVNGVLEIHLRVGSEAVAADLDVELDHTRPARLEVPCLGELVG